MMRAEKILKQQTTWCKQKNFKPIADQLERSEKRKNGRERLIRHTFSFDFISNTNPLI